jgi:hypothetical protein
MTICYSLDKRPRMRGLAQWREVETAEGYLLRKFNIGYAATPKPLSTDLSKAIEEPPAVIDQPAPKRRKPRASKLTDADFLAVSGLTVAEATKALSCSPRTLQRKRAELGLPNLKLGRPKTEAKADAS